MSGTPFGFGHLFKRLDCSTYVEREKEAVVFGSTRLTYGQLRDRVAKLANAMMKDGVNRGDRIAVLMKNDTAWFDILFATWSVGAVAVPVNFLLKAAEVAFVLKDSGATTLFAMEEFLGTAEEALSEAPDCKRLFVVGAEKGRFKSYEKFRDVAEAVFPEVHIEMTDNALLQYTSGTTGFPKGAQHTVSSLLWMNYSQIFDFDITKNERYLALPAMCWAAGSYDFVMATLWVGGTVVLYPTGGLNVAEVLETIAREKTTRCLMVPTVLKQVVEHPEIGTFDVSSWQYVLTGAEAVPVAVIEKSQKVLPTVNVIQGYGLSEGPVIATFLRAEDAVRKLGSCGRAVSNCEIRIVDDDDNEVATDNTGELVLRSSGTMVGYWNRPDATAETLKNGWLHTGDLASKDEEGYFTIRGRKKDMYISGGLNVYPAEIEALILADTNVLECAVVGISDPKWGEVGHTVLVAKPGAKIDVDAIHTMLKAKLATFKLPKATSVWSEPLPRTASGKVREVRGPRQAGRKIMRLQPTAHGVVFLASDEASFITGSGITIDGGLTPRT